MVGEVICTITIALSPSIPVLGTALFISGLFFATLTVTSPVLCEFYDRVNFLLAFTYFVRERVSYTRHAFQPTFAICIDSIAVNWQLHVLWDVQTYSPTGDDICS